MALDKDTLEEKIRNLLDLTKDPKAADETDCATKISEYVDAYLAGIELDAFSGPATNPTSGATAPPGPKTEPSSPVTAPKFKAKLIEVMTGRSGDFSPVGPEFALDMAAVTEVKDPADFTSTGVTECATPPDLDVAFEKGNPGGKDHVEVAKELAKQIHTATTSTKFSGPAFQNEEGFVGGPHADKAFK